MNTVFGDDISHICFLYSLIKLIRYFICFDDINDASERVWDMLENFKEVVEALESTNEACCGKSDANRASRA